MLPKSTGNVAKRVPQRVAMGHYFMDAQECLQNPWTFFTFSDFSLDSVHRARAVQTLDR